MPRIWNLFRKMRKRHRYEQPNTNRKAAIVGIRVRPWLETLEDRCLLNSAPIISDPGDQTNYENDLISLQINISDPDGDPLYPMADGLPDGLFMDEFGLISGTISDEAADYSPHSVTIMADDGNPGGYTEMYFNWTVNDVSTNTAPTITNPGDQFNAENDAVSLQISAGDADGDPLIYMAGGLPDGLSIDPATGLISGTISDLAAAGSPYSVEVSVDDSSGEPNGLASVFFEWTVDDAGGTNEAPVAVGESYSVVHDGWLNVSAAAGVLANDSDADNDPLSAELVSWASNGWIDLYSDGDFDYTPNMGFVGTDSFTYQVYDGTEYSNTVTVTIDVTNQAPVAVGESYSVIHDGWLNVSAAEGVLANDSDGDNDWLSAELVTTASNGWISLYSDGDFDYTPDIGFVGTDSFTYHVFDGAEYSNTVTVTIDVTNQAPIAVGESYSVLQDDWLYVSAAAGVLANDSDPDNDQLTAELYTATSNGLISFYWDGAFDYTPNIGFVGFDNFSYQAFDGVAYSAPVTVTIDVENVNDAPEFDSPGNPDPDEYTFNVVENSANGTAIGIVTATDPENDPLTYSITAGNEAGGFAINATTGQITVADVAQLDHETTAQFTLTVQVSDTALTDMATVFVNVQNANEAPVVGAIADQNGIEGRESNWAVVANDPDGDVVTYSAAGLPGGLTIDPNTGVISGKKSYTSAGNHNVTVTATDPGGLQSSVNFVWTVEDATIGAFRGTELNGGAALPNSVTVADAVNVSSLYVAPGNTVRLEVFVPVGGHLPQWADIVYLIDGPGATPASGSFTFVNWPEISFTGAATANQVKAGTDLNLNGSLDAAEITHRFIVRVIDFEYSTVGSQRVGGGPGLVEPGLTPTKYAEHFEIGGNFKFEIMDGSAGGPNSMIRYEVWDTDGFHELLASGWGHSFTYTFGAGTAEGDVVVSFHADANNNGVVDIGEIFFDSPEFWVMPKRVFNIVVDVSDDIPGAAAFAGIAAMQNRFDFARNILLRKDSANDWRAAVQFNVTMAATPVFAHTDSAGARPDPVTNPLIDTADVTKHLDAEADVVFVKDIVGQGGWTGNRDWHRIVVGYDSHFVGGVFSEARIAGTIAHEMGHGVDLSHPSPDDATNNHRVMTTDWDGSFDHLTQAEARAFDSGPLLLDEPPREGDSGAAALTDVELGFISDKARARLPGARNGARLFKDIEITIVDLPGSLLGLTSENTIWIDQNAAGHGWFIDTSPHKDSEFPIRLSEHEFQALPGTEAFGKADLLTVLLHEMSHILGREHGTDHELTWPPRCRLGFGAFRKRKENHWNSAATKPQSQRPFLRGEKTSSRAVRPLQSMN